MLTQDIARRMEEEHAVVDRLASGLREWVAAVPKSNFGHWIDGARQRFEHFRAHLVRHFSLEATEGYLPAVVRLRPDLNGEVTRLAHEHSEMLLLMDALNRDLRALVPTNRLLIHDICRRIEHFLGYLEHHEDTENLMIITVFVNRDATSD